MQRGKKQNMECVECDDAMAELHVVVPAPYEIGEGHMRSLKKAFSLEAMTVRVRGAVQLCQKSLFVLSVMDHSAVHVAPDAEGTRPGDHITIPHTRRPVKFVIRRRFDQLHAICWHD